MRDDVRQEMISLLGRIVGDKPLPADLQRIALGMLAELAQSDSSAPTVMPRASALSAALATTPMDVGAVATRRLIYVHGICRHTAQFSDPWWQALHPFVPNAFGAGQLGQTRLEVIWSDIVNLASTNLATAVAAASAGQMEGEVAASTFGGPGNAVGTDAARQRAADEIKEALRDRADHHILQAAVRNDGVGAGPVAAADTLALISIPGLNCVDDFSIYLTSDSVRQQIIDRFATVVRPEIQAGHELDVVSHSWGTVVAYEGLRQLDDEGLQTPLVRNLFTVGAALSIGPVKLRLRAANKDGKKPASVRRWVNLVAHGDIVGGPLKGRPYAVDFDFVKLEAFGCSSFLGLVNPGCAHSSYFETGNVPVNRDIFARYMNSTNQ